MSFFDQPVAKLVESIQNGSVTCEEVTSYSLKQIATTRDTFGAYITVMDKEARARAKDIDALSATDRKSLPLAGVPIAIKDNICTRGIQTTCGSRMLQSFVPPYDAGVIESLTAAGAVIVGKTNLDEFAMGSSTETSYAGVTRNPHDPERIPGGSSGGSAAAVASATVPLSLGSDTGGSIRQPCSHCGVAGLKPTYGRVSRYGLVAFASSLDQIGPIARNVSDLGILLESISSPDPRDSTNGRTPFTNSPDLYTGDLRGLTVGIPKEYFGEGLAPEVRASVEQAIETCKDRGATFVDVSIPNLQFAIATYYIVCTAEASSNLARYDGVKYGFRADDARSLIDMYETTREQGFGAEVKRRIMLGTYVLSAGYYDAYYLKAARVRTLIGNDFDNVFTQCQAIVAPVTPTPAFKLGEKSQDPLEMYLTDIYTVSANLAGIPAISVPCRKDGWLPVGVQFMAPKWKEDTLLKLGHAVQTS